MKYIILKHGLHPIGLIRDSFISTAQTHTRYTRLSCPSIKCGCFVNNHLDVNDSFSLSVSGSLITRFSFSNPFFFQSVVSFVVISKQGIMTTLQPFFSGTCFFFKLPQFRVVCLFPRVYTKLCTVFGVEKKSILLYNSLRHFSIREYVRAGVNRTRGRRIAAV